MSETPVDLDQFDPFGEAVQQNPQPWWDAMRERGHVFHDERTGYFWVASREAVLEAVADTDRFSSQMGAYMRTPPDASVVDQVAEIRAQGWPEVPVLQTQDPPIHRRQRALVSKAFTPKRVKELEPQIVALVDELLDDMTKASPVDVVATFAVPLPVLVIARLLSVPDERRADVKRWSDNRFLNLGNRVTPEQHIMIAESEVERQHYFADLLEQRRENPQDDLLTALIEARITEEDGGTVGDQLTMAEMLSMLGQMLAAGNETTTSLLSQLMLLLAEQPQWWEWLREEPQERAAPLVEEGLRYFSPTQAMPRVATADIEFFGHRIPEGSALMVLFASANRDAEHFENPAAFDPTRPNVREHLAFGRGAHVCLGAPLARLQSVVALRELVNRVESMKVIDSSRHAYLPSFRQRGLARLELEIVPA